MWRRIYRRELTKILTEAEPSKWVLPDQFTVLVSDTEAAAESDG